MRGGCFIFPFNYLFMIATNSHSLLFLSFSFFNCGSYSRRIASHHINCSYSIVTGLELLALTPAARALIDKGRGAYQNKNRTRYDGVGLSKRKEKERKGGEKTNQKSSSRKRIINTIIFHKTSGGERV